MQTTPAPHTRHFLLSRWPLLAGAVRWFQTVQRESFNAPLEPILHYSVQRVRKIGAFTIIGHLLFPYIWSVWLPQPWESLWLRFAVGLLGLPLLFYTRPIAMSERSIQWIFSLVTWLQLPVFFSWMYLCNGGNTVWLSSMVAMILIYYHCTDWRLATLGTALGGAVAWLLFQWVGPDVPPIGLYQTKVDAMVLGFAWSAALGLGFSSANLRREHLQHTLATVGIMAHELRTPLATMSLIGEALIGAARAHGNSTPNPQVEQLARRLHGLVRSMNYQIDTQIANARLLGLPSYRESVQVGPLMRTIVTDYPYRSTLEQNCIDLHLRQDFTVEFSSALLTQVINNLLKNALKALAASDRTLQRGDLVIEVGASQGRGHITVIDRGIGIDTQLQPRIFDAFFSTDRGTGHGLGLAFCRQALLSANGNIRVESEAGKGAAFIIDLPIIPMPHVQTSEQ